jgi:hypothetical protein
VFEDDMSEGGRMDIAISWDSPLPLMYHSKGGALYSVELERIPEAYPGIYLFIRAWGENHGVLYVGKATKLRTRVAQQFNNLNLMRGIESAPTGARLLVVGTYWPNKGAQLKIMLPMIERAIIRHYLDLGHSLLNIQGTKLVKHAINSERSSELKNVIPKRIYFEKRK